LRDKHSPKRYAGAVTAALTSRGRFLGFAFEGFDSTGEAPETPRAREHQNIA
jgi:hypothetical protein